MNNTRWAFTSSKYYERDKQEDVTEGEGQGGGVCLE